MVCPGFVDMHVHLREPGQEHKETIATGTAAAAAGGFTAVACMPNTQPVNDSAAVTRAILERASLVGVVRVYPIGAVSKGMKGESLAEIADLREAGCVAISDDGKPVLTALLMRRALEYAGMFDLPVIDHCEEPTLKGEGVAHEGYVASMLGLRGIPATAESIMVERDIALAEMTGSAVHIAHLSTRQALRGVWAAKARGILVTCEVTPHHFTLTDERLTAPVSYDTNLKMNPPLREQADVDAILQGLRAGTVDAIATDHAPHQQDEKHVEFDRAPFGIIGLETAVPLTLDRLVHARRHHAASDGAADVGQPQPHPEPPRRHAQARAAGRSHHHRPVGPDDGGPVESRNRSRATPRSAAGRCAAQWQRPSSAGGRST